MKRKMTRKEKGFTIIEVVLVLAIAGLIFLMVFIALPALQMMQRNTQRRNDLSLIRAAFEQRRKVTRKVVTDGFGSRDESNGFCTFYRKYLSDLKDPSTGRAYKVALWGSTQVVDCITGETFERNGYDPDVHGSAHSGESDNWAMMEPGDIQFDDTAYCTEDGGFEDDVSKKLGQNVYSGTNLYAIRIKFENGATACVDGAY